MPFMEGMEKIISRIKSEAAERASGIKEKAQSQAKLYLAEEKASADEESAAVMKNAKAQGEEIILRGRSMAELEARKMVLASKQELIDQVFDMVLEKLKSMDQEKYFNLIKNITLTVCKGNERLILSGSDRKRIPAGFIDSVNKALVESGRPGEIVLSEESRETNGGVVLASEQAELNYTFQSIIRMTRDDLESEIVKILFGDSAEAGVS